MKIITDDGKELNVEELQPIVIDGTKKVIITIKQDCYNIDTNIVDHLNRFFGEGKWLISTQSLDIGVENE